MLEDILDFSETIIQCLDYHRDKEGVTVNELKLLTDVYTKINEGIRNYADKQRG